MSVCEWSVTEYDVEIPHAGKMIFVKAAWILPRRCSSMPKIMSRWCARWPQSCADCPQELLRNHVEQCATRFTTSCASGLETSAHIGGKSLAILHDYYSMQRLETNNIMQCCSHRWKDLAQQLNHCSDTFRKICQIPSGFEQAREGRKPYYRRTRQRCTWRLRRGNDGQWAIARNHCPTWWQLTHSFGNNTPFGRQHLVTNATKPCCRWHKVSFVAKGFVEMGKTQDTRTLVA